MNCLVDDTLSFYSSQFAISGTSLWRCERRSSIPDRYAHFPMYNSFTLWVGLSRSTLQNACKAGKDPQMPKFHSFLLLSLIDRFGKKNSQLAKYIRVTRNWSYQKLFCMILSNICFFVLFCKKKCFMLWKKNLNSWKFSWSPESLKNRTWFTGLERKAHNWPKIYA